MGDGEGEEDDAEHHSHARLLMGDAQPSDVPLANSHPLQLPQPAGDEPLRRRWGSGPLEVDSGGLPASASTKVANDGTAAAHAGLMAALEIESDDSVRSGRELPSPTRLMPVLQQQSQQQPKQLGKNIDAEAVAGAPLLASAADAGPSQALLPRPPSRMLPGGIGPRKRTYMVSIFSLVAALLYADQNLLAPNLTAAAEDFGFDETERDKYLGGWIAAGFYLVGAPAALLFGYLADRCNRRNMLFLAVLLGEGPCILTYFVTKYWQLLVLRLLTGISLGGALPLVFSLLGDLFDPSKRAAVSAMVQLATGIGLALGQGVAGFVGPAIGWRWPFVIVAMPAVLLAVVMLVTVPEPQRGGTEAALQVHFEGLFGCLPWGMILTFLNDYLSQNKGLAVPTATTVLLVLGIGGGVGVVGGGAMGQWLYNRHKWSMPLFIGGCTILGTAPLWFLVNADVASMLWLAFIAAGAAGMLSGTVGPNMRAMILNVNEPETRGLALALQTMLDDLGKGKEEGCGARAGGGHHRAAGPGGSLQHQHRRLDPMRLAADGPCLLGTEMRCAGPAAGLVAAMALLALLHSSVAAADPPQPLGKWAEGSAQAAAADSNATLEQGSCNYGASRRGQRGRRLRLPCSTDAWPFAYTAAYPPASNATHGLSMGGCGACFEVQANNNPLASGNSSSGAGVVVTMVGACPACQPGSVLLSYLRPSLQSVCRGGAVHPGGRGGGRIRLHLVQVAGGGGIQSVWLRGALTGANATEATWRPMNNTDGASWELSDGKPLFVRRASFAVAFYALSRRSSHALVRRPCRSVIPGTAMPLDGGSKHPTAIIAGVAAGCAVLAAAAGAGAWVGLRRRQRRRRAAAEAAKAHHDWLDRSFEMVESAPPKNVDLLEPYPILTPPHAGPTPAARPPLPRTAAALRHHQSAPPPRHAGGPGYLLTRTASIASSEASDVGNLLFTVDPAASAADRPSDAVLGMLMTGSLKGLPPPTPQPAVGYPPLPPAQQIPAPAAHLENQPEEVLGSLHQQQAAQRDLLLFSSGSSVLASVYRAGSDTTGSDDRAGHRMLRCAGPAAGLVAAMALLALLHSSVAAADPPQPLGKWAEGSAQAAAADSNATLEQGSCNYGASRRGQRGRRLRLPCSTDAWPFAYTAAYPPASNATHGLSMGGCGACFEVQANNNPLASGNSSSGAGVVVTMVGACPACQPGSVLLSYLRPSLQSVCRGGAVHPGGRGGGRIRLHLVQVAGGGGIQSVWLRGALTGANATEATWRPMNNTDGASWELSGVPPGPLDLLAYSDGKPLFARSAISYAVFCLKKKTSVQFNASSALLTNVPAGNSTLDTQSFMAQLQSLGRGVLPGKMPSVVASAKSGDALERHTTVSLSSNHPAPSSARPPLPPTAAAVLRQAQQAMPPRSAWPGYLLTRSASVASSSEASEAGNLLFSLDPSVSTSLDRPSDAAQHAAGACGATCPFCTRGLVPLPPSSLPKPAPGEADSLPRVEQHLEAPAPGVQPPLPAISTAALTHRISSVAQYDSLSEEHKEMLHQLCPARPPFPSWAQRAAAAALATGSTAALATGPWDASMLSSAASTVQGMINPFMLFSATTPTKLQHQGPGGAVSGATGFGARRVEVEAVSPPAPLPPLPTLRSQLSSDLAAAAAAALEEGLCSPRLETVQSGDLAGGEVWVGHSGPVPLQKQGSGMAQFALQDMLIADTPHALETATVVARPYSTAAMAQTTYVMIKPDGVQRNLIAPILERFLSKGYTLRGLKFLNVPKDLAERHYADLSSKPFFPSLIDYITSGPVVAIALEGKDVVIQARKIIGATNPLAADPGSIRGTYCIDVGRNIIHGSDSVENAQKELALWFPEGLVDNVPLLRPMVYE
eukprot:scaffold5.g1012.t1